MDDRAAAEGLIAAGRRLGARGLISAGEGNLSVRLDADRLLMTPTGLRKDELAADDLVVVWPGHPDREARSPSGHGPSSDLAIHLAVHAARPDIAAVAHAHLPASMSLTLAGEIPDPGALPETAFHLPRLPFLAFGEMGSQELADRIAAALGRPAGRGRAGCGRGPPRAARCGRRRSRPGPRGQPARARRGPVPDVARRAPDSRGEGRCGYRGGAQAIGNHGGSMNAARLYLAELLGTFLFLTIGYAAVANFNASTPATAGILVVPFAFGLGLLAAIFAFGHVSGGHYNPAVTIAMVLDKRTTPVEAVGYIIAQVIGAIGAGAIILISINQDAVKAGITKPGAGISDVSALILEITFTAFFLIVILTASKRAGSLAGVAIALALVAIHFALSTLTGSSVNPARSIGSAVVGGDLNQLWIYLVGPIVGGIIGWGIYRAMEMTSEEPAA